MTLSVPMTVFVAVSVFASSAVAQGFRGFTTGGGTSSASGHSSPPASPMRNGAPGSVTITRPRAAVIPAPGTSIHGAPQVAVPQVAVPRFVPPVVHGGVATGAVSNAQGSGVPSAAMPRGGSPVISGGGFAMTPSHPVGRPSGVVIGSGRPSHRPHRPTRPFIFYPYAYRYPYVYPYAYPYVYAYPYARSSYPGIVVLDTPYYSSNTVITELAPGVVREERRYADEPPAEARTRSGEQLAPFDPTPQEIIERMLRLAAVKTGDVLYDLGAGDGRVVIAAAKKFAIKAVGFEIDPGLVKLARENVRKQGVEHLVEIRQQDFLTADLAVPSVVTLYLSYDGNLALRPRLMSQLKTGARVVSYTFDMAEWQPKATENYRDAAGNSHMIYLWEIGGPLAFTDVAP